MSALNFPGSTKPAHLTVDVKRRSQGSVPGMTPGAVRVWKFACVLALVITWGAFFWWVKP